MNSICLFSSYFQGGEIPYYVKVYLEELGNYFEEVVLLTNIKELNNSEKEYLTKHHIQSRLYDNEGMDFGMWHKALGEFNKDYDRIGLINDSCILLKSLQPFFDWVNLSSLDYAGMITTGKVSLHIQSYFLVVNKNAIGHVRKFFEVNGIKKTYKGIIMNYEIGLSEYLLANGMKIGGFYDYSARKDVNPAFILAGELIKKGSPIIKKKILSHTYYVGDYLTWFRNNFIIDHRYYVALIKDVCKGNLIVDIDKVVLEVQGGASLSYIRKYNFGLAVYKILSKSFILKFIFHQLILLRRRLRKEEK